MVGVEDRFGIVIPDGKVSTSGRLTPSPITWSRSPAIMQAKSSYVQGPFGEATGGIQKQAGRQVSAELPDVESEYFAVRRALGSVT